MALSPRRTPRAFTLTELLTVVSVITILTSMMAPVLLRVRQEAGRIKCTSNLKQVHEALELVANRRNGKLPKCFEMQAANPTLVNWPTP